MIFNYFKMYRYNAWTWVITVTSWIAKLQFATTCVTIQKAIAAPVLAKSFNDETLIIRGETVRYVMERTAQFGINNYLALQRDCTQHWNFHNAFFFAGTVATTIGKYFKRDGVLVRVAVPDGPSVYFWINAYNTGRYV